jgi:hypothetical protein
MRRPVSQRLTGRITGDLRPYLSFSLGQSQRPTGTGDLRVTNVSRAMAARVVGARQGAPPTPHADHVVIGTRLIGQLRFASTSGAISG